jgi:hypothetical protein
MRVLSFLFSIIALIISFLAYQEVKDLGHLRPIAQAVSEAKLKAESAKGTGEEKTASPKERLAELLVNLAEEIKR